MSELVSLGRDGDVAIITINNPPVNALSPGVPEGIRESVEAAEKDDSVRAIVLIGGGRTFIAGADIKEFGKMTSGRARREVGLNPVLGAIEGLPQAGGRRDPRHGLRRRAGDGDGLPLSRGGRRPPRSASRRSSWGSSPARAARSGCRGWRAWRRPPRCAPAASPSPRPRPCSSASSTGSSTATCCQGPSPSRARSPRRASRRRKTRDLTEKLGDPRTNASIFAAARDAVKKRARGMLAPLKALDAVEAATTLPFAEGLQARSGTLPRVPLLGPVEGADPRLLRRARGRQGPRHSRRTRRSIADHDRRRSSARARWAAASP